MTIGPQKDEKDDKSPKRWQTLEKMTTDNSDWGQMDFSQTILGQIEFSPTILGRHEGGK